MGSYSAPIPSTNIIIFIHKKKYIRKKNYLYTENGILYIGLMDAPNGHDADLSTLSTLAKKVE